MFDKVEPKLDLVKIDKEMLEYWEKDNTFEKQNELRKDAKPFVFFEGPPGMNGLPHIGHATTRIYKDTILRYQSMIGKKIIRKAGWDTHGLPVEQKAEKELGLQNKQEIEKIGVKTFVEKCKEIVYTYEKEWREATKKIGFWVDFDKAYLTCDDKYIESVWWSLKQLFDKGDIYQGYRISPYCPRCGTSQASHEVAQGYKTVKDKTVYVRFKSKQHENTYFVAWTTTPWTLPSNTALAVNPEIEYAKVKVGEEFYIVATSLAGKVFEEYEIVETYNGKDLEKNEYEPVFALSEKLFDDKKLYYVVCADYVTTTDGTGIVHIAPAFGQDDSLVGKAYNLPFINLIDDKGCFTSDIKKYEGKRNIVANLEIIEDLKQSGAVIKELLYEHEYPHCWRCHTPLIYCARDSWFVRMTKYRDQLVENNNQVDWHPSNVKDGRMGNFLQGVVDWNLSRDRYWGTPLNIWKCEKCGKLHAIGSKQELKEKACLEKDVELHKPYIDEVTFECECGATMRRVPQVIDCWYDSGAMPFAQWHYPFENQELFKSQFPADFISEAQDQTRGWFYTLQAISTSVFGKTPYKSCVMCAHVNDKNGLKMSKSLGNVVSADELIDKFGADAVRFYFCSNSAPWLSKKFNEDDVAEVQRKYISTLWNTYSFFVLYANIDKFDGNVDIKDCNLSLMDKWVLSELNTLILTVRKLMDNFNFTDATREIEAFVEKLSNWYVRRCRERFWVDGECADKTAAFATLYNVLVNVVKLSAPFIPFMSDKIYQNLCKNGSVHLADYPVVDESLIDEKLEKSMKDILDIVTLGRAVRSETGVKTRQPLANMYVHSVNGLEFTDEEMAIIKEDLNIKNLKIIEDAGEYITFELKPQLKTLGPKYGAKLGKIREFLSSVNANEFVTKLRSGQMVKVGDDIELGLDDVLIYPQSKPDFCADVNNGITVVLDTVLTNDLIAEGHMREIVSKIQNIRKEAGLEVEDKIYIEFEADEEISKIIENFENEIKTVVLAVEIKNGKDGGFVKDVDINGHNVKIAIKKV